MTTLKPPCKKRFLARTIHDLAEVAAHFGVALPDGHDVALKTLEQRPWSWFAKALYDASGPLYSKSIACQMSPMDRRWGAAMHVAYGTANIGALIYIGDARPGGSLERYLDSVGVLVEIDREKHPKRLYEADGGPAFCSPRYHLQTLDGRVITWGNCTPRNIVSHRVVQMSRNIFESIYPHR